MPTRSKSVSSPMGGGGDAAEAEGAIVPLVVLLRREVVSERTAAEWPELQAGLASQTKKGKDVTFLKPDCVHLHGVPSYSSAFGILQALEKLFAIDSVDYMLVICGNEALRELASPRKSGSLFYLTQDDRFIIKTVKK